MLSRRRFLRRSAAVTAAAPVFSAFLSWIPDADGEEG
jgi:hypothetical protein